MARLNLALLTEAVNDQRKPGDDRDATELLDPEQKDMYLRAISLLQEHASVVGPERKL